MTEELPDIFGDRRTWGIKLNDFLRVSHNADGTIQNDAIDAALVAAGVPSGAEWDAAADQIDANTTAIARVDPGTPVPPDHVMVIEGSTPEWTPRPDGRSRVLLYDDFSTYSNGSPSGSTTAVGGITWSTTGAQPPTVTSGALNSTGSGYLVATLESRPYAIEGEFSFSGTGGSWTLTIYRSDAASFNSILHLQGDHDGSTLTIRGDGGTFDNVLGVSWPSVLLDGTKYRIKMILDGPVITIVGPHGKSWTATDPRASELLGDVCDSVFWQAGGDCLLHTVAVYGRNDSGITSNNDGPYPVQFPAPKDGVIAASPLTPYQVSIGVDVSSRPAIMFSAVDGVRVPLLADVIIGATTVSLQYPLYGYSSAVIGFGANAETVTISGTSGPGPFTITVSALTKNHSAGDVFLVATPSGNRTSIYYDIGGGLLMLPGDTATAGLLELGTARDTGIQRTTAGAVSSIAATGAICVFRTGYGATGSRPSAATVGAGSMYFDTTLNKLITSNGTDWRDGSGASV